MNVVLDNTSAWRTAFLCCRIEDCCSRASLPFQSFDTTVIKLIFTYFFNENYRWICDPSDANEVTGTALTGKCEVSVGLWTSEGRCCGRCGCWCFCCCGRRSRRYFFSYKLNFVNVNCLNKFNLDNTSAWCTTFLSCRVEDCCSRTSLIPWIS